MKAKMLGLVTMFVFVATMVFGANGSEKIKVEGKSEMCKQHIEKAAKTVEGVTKADWDKETKMLTVDFDESQTSLDDIEKAIAKSGHGTPNYQADEEALNKLPDACKHGKEKESKNESEENEEY